MQKNNGMTLCNDFTLTLLRWYRENRRELPWRDTADAYAIWLSEIILQQTRIEQGRPYWERFMREWPTVEQLASATEDEVLRLWQGLGYYSRARNLHKAAQQVVAMGGFPQTIEGLKSLKGVGDYTAAAIGSMAFGLPAAVVDGNVYRVLARHYGIPTPINSTEGKKEFAALAQSLLPEDRAADFNQAMMDFGAMQCVPQNPQCGVCPLMESCVALRKGRVGELPVKLKKLEVKTRRLAYIYIRWNGCVALHRRGPGDIWQGLWEPYFIEGGQLAVEGSLSPLTSHLSSLTSQLSALTSQLKLLRKGVKHALTHRILLADFYLMETAGQPVLPDGYQWVSEDELDRYGVPRLVELLFEAVAADADDKDKTARFLP